MFSALRKTAMMGTAMLLGLLAGRTAMASPHLLDFTGELGSHATVWAQCAGTMNPLDIGCVYIDGPTYAEVENNTNIYEALLVPWSDAVEIYPYVNFEPATYVTFDLYVYAGTVIVSGYGGAECQDQFFVREYEDGTYPVELEDEEGICTIKISEGDNETWVDDIVVY